ncbi:MAG: hypothetical protein KC423_17360 [Anaerolineales bacterium]|nr:hypothetical protein [Anaerolineales bacterium]
MWQFARRVWWAGLMVVVVGLTAVSPPTLLHAQDPITPPPDPRFGAIESFWAPAEAAELTVGWERILFYWSEIQPTGPDDWNTLHVLEEWLAEANTQQRTVLGLLNKGFALEQDERGRLTEPTRRKLAEKILARLESNERYEQKRYPLRVIIQRQARHLATYVRGERERYEPFRASW